MQVLLWVTYFSIMSQFLESDVKNFLQGKDLCIIGFMGAGKTTFGELLAKELKSKLLDIDKMIELKENKLIFEIFKEKGEKYFRALEKNLLQDIVFAEKTNIENPKEIITQSCSMSSSHSKIIVCGGGLPLKKGNQKLLKLLNTFFICLNPSFEVILSRIRGSKRPLIYRHSRKAIFTLWSDRYEIYQRLADISISEAGTEEIFQTLNQRVKLYIKSREQ